MAVLLIELCSKLLTTEVSRGQQIARETLDSRARRARVFLNWPIANDPDARQMFECLLAYAKGEGRAGLH